MKHFSIDMPYGDAHFIVYLPGGMYTVKTFNVAPRAITDIYNR